MVYKRIMMLTLSVILLAGTGVSCKKYAPVDEGSEQGGEEKKEPEKTPDPISYDLTIKDGIITYDGIESMPSGTVAITEGDEAMWNFYYRVDGSEEYTLKNLRKGAASKSLAHWSEKLTMGEHTLTGRFVCDESGREEVKVERTFWMASSRIEELSVQVETRLKYFNPANGETVTINTGEKGTIKVSYKPEKALYLMDMTVSDTDAVMLDVRNAVMGKGLISVPFEVKKGAMVDFNVSLKTGSSDAVKFACKFDTTAEPLKTVQEVTVPQNVTVSLGQPGSFTLGAYPENAVDAKVMSAVSSSADLAVISCEGLTVNLEGRWPGDYSVEVEVGEAKIRKTVPVKVVGSVVKGFVPSVAVDGMEIGRDKTVNLFIYPDPADAYDANTVKVESSDPVVLSVVSNGGHSYTLQGNNFGEADVIASTRGASASYHVRVPETLSLDKDAYECGYGNSVTIQVGGDYKDITLFADGKEVVGYFDLGFCKITQEGRKVIVQNTNRTLENKGFTLSVKTAVFGVTRTAKVSVKGMSNTVNISGSNVGRGADGKIRFDFSITNEKMQPYTVNSFYGYLVNDSVDQMDIVARCEEILRSGTYMDDIVEKEGEFSEPRIIARSFNVKFDVVGFPESVAPGGTAEFSWTPSKSGDAYGEYNSETILVGRIDGSTGVIIWDY